MYEVLVFLALLSAAMLVGLMTTLLTVMRAMWRGQSDETAASSFHYFLKHAATNRVLSTLSIIPVICAIVIGFIGAPTTAKYASTLAGGGVFLVGFFIWTGLFNAPIYKAVSNWDAGSPPANVRSLLHRFHRANVVRLGATLVTTALFFLAA